MGGGVKWDLAVALIRVSLVPGGGEGEHPFSRAVCRVPRSLQPSRGTAFRVTQPVDLQIEKTPER